MEDEFSFVEETDFIPINPDDIWIKYIKKSCSISWKLPRQFYNLPSTKCKQEVIIKKGFQQNVCKRATMLLPKSSVEFFIDDAQIYDIFITITSPDLPEIVAKTIVKIATANKKIARKKMLQPKTISLMAKVSALHCKVEWPDNLVDEDGKLKLRICSNGIWNSVNPKFGVNCFDMLTVPGRLYFFELRKYNVKNRLIFAGDVWFKATYSPKEMKKLYERAEEHYKDSSLRKFMHFYRCKPSDYFENIKKNYDGIMEIYMKDLTGHSANPINHRLNGLFFFAKLTESGKFFKTSPFGDTRWFINAFILFDPRRDNLYFADYYCTYDTHYVIIVIATKESETDSYCKNRLILLDPYKNPFLTVCWNSQSNQFDYYLNMDIWVEIFYTENLPLSLGRIDSVEPKYRGRSTNLGLPNNKFCEICNLYPQNDNNGDLRKFCIS